MADYVKTLSLDLHPCESVHYWVESNFCGPVKFSVQLMKSNVWSSCLDYELTPAGQKFDFEIALFYSFLIHHSFSAWAFPPGRGSQ